jgi:hypothetical protein
MSTPMDHTSKGKLQNPFESALPFEDPEPEKKPDDRVACGSCARVTDPRVAHLVAEHQTGERIDSPALASWRPSYLVLGRLLGDQ